MLYLLLDHYEIESCKPEGSVLSARLVQLVGPVLGQHEERVDPGLHAVGGCIVNSYCSSGWITDWTSLNGIRLLFLSVSLVSSFFVMIKTDSVKSNM